MNYTNPHVHFQGEPFVPVLFMVPTLFIATMVLREGLGVRTLSPTARCARAGHLLGMCAYVFRNIPMERVRMCVCGTH